MSEKAKSAVQRASEFIKGPRGESIRYLVIGGITTLVDYLSYYGMVRLLGIDVTVSNIISTVLAILFAYVTNKLVVFRSRAATTAGLVAEFLKFIAARLVTMVLEIGGVYVFVNILGQDNRLGKAEAIVVVVITNYFLSKFLVFKKLQE